ncbi:MULTISPECIES: YheC/YheD family protein [unclassified Bacillus (in: firmicutes)]|uniref:YheC/YheD family endospore coat-associated protein n=1 Tax=unclassified Bacillus (in: firmicutes) TaxID=185979 RepID=UPI001BE58A5D|nr:MULTISPECIES: YheC/YheD family protein [unclassified Bacillus (in: firmicutes)]MBT2618673.1 YheC/YheD family protein [Bacillus sp. ISL-78]MBT2719205.1 YheC/YheD family protein [Bacillus sp. ISL-57]
MTLVGMLHHRADPQKVTRTYAYSVVAKAEGVNFFYFTAGKVNIQNQTILGKIYEDGKWVDKEFPFPDAIFNASYPTSEKGEEIVDFLYERIPFTSHSIGNKMSVHETIQQAKEFEQYLIPTLELTGLDILTKMVDTYPKVIVKPLSGHQGGGIAFIEKEKQRKYKINEAGQISYFDKDQMLEFVSDKIRIQDYLVQQYISCKTKSGNVYDFRLHVQKNGEGKWVITSIYPRIGPSGSITSNLGSGGYTGFPESFLKYEFKDSWYDIKRTLEYFAISFTNHFDSLYDSTLDELGIDVGIDENQKIWIFEVNWRPGIPVIFNGELDVARNTILYAKYLADMNKK